MSRARGKLSMPGFSSSIVCFSSILNVLGLEEEEEEDFEQTSGQKKTKMRNAQPARLSCCSSDQTKLVDPLYTHYLGHMV